MSSFTQPVLTSFIAGLGTAVGGALIWFLDDCPSDNSIAFSLSFAGGVMITVSVIDLFIPIASISWLSCIFALGCVSIGWFLSSFAAKVKLPEPEDLALYMYQPIVAGGGTSTIGSNPTSNHNNNTLLPSIHTHHHHHHITPQNEENISIGSSLSPSPSSFIDSSSNTSTVMTTITLAGTDSNHTLHTTNSTNNRKAWRLGLLLCLVLSAHNFPEGILVGVGIEKSVKLGNLLAMAIWLHNVAEGYVVSLPLFAATQNRKFAFGIAALSGLTEPLGAFIGVFVLRLILGISNNTETVTNDTLSASSSTASLSSSSSTSIFSLENILNSILCCVGGVMAQVSFKELLPQASKYGNNVTVSFGFLSGVCMIMATTFLLSSSM